jgi:hypothetical protein
LEARVAAGFRHGEHQRRGLHAGEECWFSAVVQIDYECGPLRSDGYRRLLAIHRAWQVHIYADKPRTKRVGGVHPGGPRCDPRHRVPTRREPPGQVEGHNYFIFADQGLG